MSVSPDIAAHAARWPARRAAIAHNARHWAGRAALVAGLGAGVATLTAPLGVGVILCKLLLLGVPLGVGLGIRLGVLAVALRQSNHLGRRALLRWIPRLLWVVALWGYGWALVPVANVVALPVTVVAHVAAAALYARFTVDREVRGLAPHWLEWTVLGIGALAVLGSVVLVTLLAAAVGYSVHALLQLATPG